MLRVSRLDVWVERGLLSPEQSLAIKAFEDQDNKHHWAGYSIAAVGAFALITGIVSIVAANWGLISWQLKLVGYLLLQSLLALASCKLAAREDRLSELVMALHALFLFAGIALTAQIFNISGPLWRPYAFWLVMTAPMALLSRHHFFPILWAVLSLWTLLYWVTPWQRIDNSIVTRFQYAEILFFSILVAAYLFRGRDIFGVAMVASIRWLYSVCLFFFVLVAGSCVYYANSEDLAELRELLEPHFIVTLFAWILPVAALMFMPKSLSWFRKILVASVVMLSFSYVFGPIHFLWLPGKMFGAAGFFVICGLLAMTALNYGHRRLFDFLSFVMVLRILVAYVEVFGSLMQTGLGLVILGVLILFLVFLWHNYRGLVAKKLGALT